MKRQWPGWPFKLRWRCTACPPKFPVFLTKSPIPEVRSKRGAPDEKLLAFARCQCRFQCRCLGGGFPGASFLLRRMLLAFICFPLLAGPNTWNSCRTQNWCCFQGFVGAKEVLGTSLGSAPKALDVSAITAGDIFLCVECGNIILNLLTTTKVCSWSCSLPARSWGETEWARYPRF